MSSLNKLFDIIEEVTDVVEFVQDTADTVTDAVDRGKDIVDAAKEPVQQIVTEVKDSVFDPILDKLTEHAISIGVTPTEDMKERMGIVDEPTPKVEFSPITPKKEYFSDDELRCKHCGELIFDEDFRKKLNVARELAGNPWTVTSGYRCAQHNTAVGGDEDSSHMKGLAVDISAPTSEKKMEIVIKAYVAGIRRIGISKDFIHLDDDKTKPQEIIWLY